MLPAFAWSAALGVAFTVLLAQTLREAVRLFATYLLIYWLATGAFVICVELLS